jgi:hypothetical protein
VPLTIPDLDDRTFDQLVAEGRSLIPRYGPLWTNHNPSDPGITLMELFAYFTETAIYQLNRVPEASVEAFLRLLGACREPLGTAREPLDATVARALEELQALRRAVTAAEFEALALEAAGSLATPVVATDGSHAASVLTSGVASGSVVDRLQVRAPVFQAGQPIVVGAGGRARETNVRAVAGTTLTVAPAVQAPVDYLEAVARAEFALFRDERCAPADRPDRAPLAALVIVVPDRPDDPAPVPTVALTDALFRELLRCRLLATRVHVVPATYVPVTVKLTVAAKRGQGLRAAEVEQAVRTWLSPLSGGAEGVGWPFGRAVYRSEVHQRVESLERVDHVERLELETEPPRVATAEGIIIPTQALVEVRSVLVTVTE